MRLMSELLNYFDNPLLDYIWPKNPVLSRNRDVFSVTATFFFYTILVEYCHSWDEKYNLCLYPGGSHVVLGSQCARIGAHSNSSVNRYAAFLDN